MTELKTLKDLEDDPKKGTSVLTIKNIREEAVNIFNESLTIEEFGKKMIRFFEIQEEDLK